MNLYYMNVRYAYHAERRLPPTSTFHCICNQRTCLRVDFTAIMGDIVGVGDKPVSTQHEYSELDSYAPSCDQRAFGFITNILMPILGMLFTSAAARKMSYPELIQE